MSRRDVIIISVLINLGLLAVLFVTAIKSDKDTTNTLDVQVLAEVKEDEVPLAPLDLVKAEREKMVEGVNDFAEPLVLDEVDHVLKEYLPEVPLDTITTQNDDPSPHSIPAIAETVTKNSEPPAGPIKENLVEITVKRGDALEKIARANQTTIEAIRKVNQLTNDKLKIGQVLKVPVGTVKPKGDSLKAKSKTPSVSANEPTYYTVKNGDNPWKIAKQYGVKFEDLLLLNQLDEEKAKNLKVGDKIRVR